MVNEPGQNGDILVFGDAERRSRRLPGGISRPSIPAVGAGTVIGVLAILVVALALNGGSQARAQRPVAQRPVAIEVLNGKSASFPLKGTAGAVLFVQYLQAGKRPESVRFTLAVAGLPRSIDYLAVAGDCVGGHPSILALVSAVPDPQTDLLILPIGNVPGSASTVIWIEVTSALGNQLGSVRGGFLAPGSTVPIAAGGPLCPQQDLAPLPASAALNAAGNAA